VLEIAAHGVQDFSAREKRESCPDSGAIDVRQISNFCLEIQTSLCPADGLASQASNKLRNRSVRLVNAVIGDWR